MLTSNEEKEEQSTIELTESQIRERIYKLRVEKTIAGVRGGVGPYCNFQVFRRIEENLQREIDGLLLRIQNGEFQDG